MMRTRWLALGALAMFSGIPARALGDDTSSRIAPSPFPSECGSPASRCTAVARHLERARRESNAFARAAQRSE